MKVTQVMIKSFIKHMLSTNSAWALRALVRIYERQTADEQAAGTTSHSNNIGFSGADAEILSSFAVQYQQRGTLSQKQMQLLHKKIARYHAQIASLIPREKLEQLVLSK